MKPIKKKTAKIFIALIVIAAVIGSVFTFVPINFGKVAFTSIAGAINISTDLGAGVYAEYDLDGDYSANQINNSISTIQEILDEKGYAGSNILSLDGQKIRLELGYPLESTSLKDSYTLLRAIGIGEFELRSSSSEDDTYIVGREHITDVEINNYNDQLYVVLNFNDAGVEAYEDLLEASDTIYVCMGGETMTSFDSTNIEAAESMPLSFPKYAEAEDFAMKVKLGSMPISLNPDTVRIGTMSSVLSFAMYPVEGSNEVNLTRIIGIVALAIMVVLALGFMAIKYGIIGLFQLIAVLFDTIIALILMWAFPWIEIGFSSLIAIGIGYAVLFASTLIFTSRFEEEYKQGKTVSASLEGAYKKSMHSILATGIALTVIFGVVAIVGAGELKVFGLITCIFSCLSLFSSLVMLPGFVNIFEAFNDGAIKPYRLPKREDN